MGTDWAAVATAAAAIITAGGAGFFATRAIRSSEGSLRDQLEAQATQNRKRQLENMTSTALGYLTGGSQNRSIGIAALRMVQASSQTWNEETWSLYSEALGAYGSSAAWCWEANVRHAALLGAMASVVRRRSMVTSSKT